MSGRRLNTDLSIVEDGRAIGELSFPSVVIYFIVTPLENAIGGITA